MDTPLLGAAPRAVPAPGPVVIDLTIDDSPASTPPPPAPAPPSLAPESRHQPEPIPPPVAARRIARPVRRLPVVHQTGNSADVPILLDDDMDDDEGEGRDGMDLDVDADFIPLHGGTRGGGSLIVRDGTRPQGRGISNHNVRKGNRQRPPGGRVAEATDAQKALMLKQSLKFLAEGGSRGKKRKRRREEPDGDDDDDNDDNEAGPSVPPRRPMKQLRSRHRGVRGAGSFIPSSDQVGFLGEIETYERLAGILGPEWDFNNWTSHLRAHAGYPPFEVSEIGFADFQFRDARGTLRTYLATQGISCPKWSDRTTFFIEVKATLGLNTTCHLSENQKHIRRVAQLNPDLGFLAISVYDLEGLGGAKWKIHPE